jgi:hypothetical protein
MRTTAATYSFSLKAICSAPTLAPRHAAGAFPTPRTGGQTARVNDLALVRRCVR